MLDFLLNALAQVATVRSYAVAAQELVQQSNMMKLLASAKPKRLETMKPEMETKHRRSPATFKGDERKYLYAYNIVYTMYIYIL